MPMVYLAGFDVFRADAVERGHWLKSLCAAHGLTGLYPFDNQLPVGLAGAVAAQWIYQQNVLMIQRCDAVLANLNTFRGAEADSGTAFEVGMAVAFGKPVWGWFDACGDMRNQIPHDSAGNDVLGYQVEDFGLPRNLMLACSWAGCSTTEEQAVLALQAFLQAAAM